MKKIHFYIQNQADGGVYFKELRILDSNALALLPDLSEDLFLFYGLFKASVQILREEERLSFSMHYPETLHPSFAFYTYTEKDGWEDTPIEFIDGNQITVSLLSEKYDIDENQDEAYRSMMIIGGLAYVSELPRDLHDSACIISTIGHF